MSDSKKAKPQEEDRTVERRDAILKRMLSTPPKPFTPKKGKGQRKKTNNGTRD